MSRKNTPTDNAVAERFMKTFKEHRVDGMSMKQWLLYPYNQNPDFKNTRSVLNKFIKSLNKNKKSFKISTQRHDNQSSNASMLMIEPKHTKAFSRHFGDDFR